MEQRYQDMLQAALAPFLAAQQNQAAPVQAQAVAPPAPEEAQPVPVQLSAEAKHLRDFRKYNPKTFDGSMDNPTKAQMWLTSIETIFRYMKCPEDQKVQCAVFFLEDRGTAWWETAERMLGGDVSKITWEQFKENFYAKFFSANVKHAKLQEFLNLEQGDMTVEQYDAEFDMLSRFPPDMVRDEAARTEKFVRGLRLDLQGIVRALRPATHADALRIALDLSLPERADSSKAAGRGSALGQKRKVETQPDVAPQRTLRSGGVFQRHRRKLAAAGRTLRELPACTTCGRVHGGRCLAGSGVCFRWIPLVALLKCISPTKRQIYGSDFRYFLAINLKEACSVREFMLQRNWLFKREVGLKCTFLRMSVIRTFSAVGMDPTIMVVGPAIAILASIKAAGHEPNDIYLFEIKEAFASQFVYCRNKLGLYSEKINVNGRAITIVHPLGATGKRRREGKDKHKLRFPKHIKIKIVRGNNWTGSCVTFDKLLRNPGNSGGFFKLYESNDRPNLPKPP
ncbi:gag-protease polyprotein [Cucumis melo var. makuwa]|uniref:Gag-protease polyprotein n=2 Tax=Cucumis melo var. makuwa TaxID=1194695 RepID=A0A5D3BIZ5_CUCMM|nr:gag-protease polyprotein [Cucumis melo var. makuwa]